MLYMCLTLWAASFTLHLKMSPSNDADVRSIISVYEPNPSCWERCFTQMGDKLKEMLMLCFKSAFWQLGNTLIFFEGKVLAQHLSWTWCVNFWFVVTCLYIWIPPSDSEWWTSFITIMKSHLMQWVKQLNTSNEINILAWNACPTKPIAIIQEWNMQSVKSTFSNFGDVTKNFPCYVNENCIYFFKIIFISTQWTFLWVFNLLFFHRKRSLLVLSHSQSTIIIVPN